MGPALGLVVPTATIFVDTTPTPVAFLKCWIVWLLGRLPVSSFHCPESRAGKDSVSAVGLMLNTVPLLK